MITTVLTFVFILNVPNAFSDKNSVHTRHHTTIDDSPPFRETIMSMPGGITEERDADAEVQAIADKLKSDVETNLGRNEGFGTFVVVKYATQVVAGINYFIKVQVGEDEYIHIRVYQNLQQEVSLAGVQADKKKDDPITYF